MKPTTPIAAAMRGPMAIFVASAMLAAQLPQLAYGRSVEVRSQGNDPKIQRWGNLPLSFEANRGQAESRYQFLARTNGLTLMTHPAGATLRVRRATIEMTLTGARAQAPAEGLSLLPGKSNYLVGTDASQYKTDIPNFARVRYRNVYPGVDVVYYGNHRNLEYDFVVNPGANPGDIRIAFTGVDNLDVDPAGDLVLHTASGELRQHKPVVYQEQAGERQEVQGKYVVKGKEVAFSVSAYDPSQSLVIDPVVAYSTYLGGAGDDQGAAVAVDPQGNAYMAGQSNLGGALNYAFVSKFNAAGTAILYTTVIGNGACDSTGHGIGVDSQGNAVVTGTYGYQDQWGYCNNRGVLVSKLNPAGNAFIYSQYFGSGDDAVGSAVAIDPQGNAYITGTTFGQLPATAGAFQTEGQGWDDAFVLKLNPAGNVLMATYLGGSWNEHGSGIAVDAAGKIYIGGSVSSGDFPITANAFQTTMANPSVVGFVTQLNAAGSLVLYSTYLGGMEGEGVDGIAIDANGNIYVTGATDSRDFPTTTNAYDRACGNDAYCNPTYVDFSWHYAEDAFVTKIDPRQAGAASIRYSSFLGGMNRDLGRAIAVDANGRVWVTGRTASIGDYPVVQPIQGSLSGDYDVFVAGFDMNQAGAASLLFSTFFGGTNYDEGQGMAVDQAGNIYVAGFTSSPNFPVHNAAQAGPTGGSDAFLFKIGTATVLTVNTLSVNPAAVTGGHPATGTVTLSAVAPAGAAVVTLSSNNASATVPVSVTVPAGATTANFTVNTTAVANAATVTLSATYGGVTRNSTLTVNPPVLTGISLNPVAVTGGASSTGTVTLSDAAPAGGMRVALATNSVAATAPSTVTVPAGAMTATFTVTTQAVTVVTPVTVSALLGAVIKPATLTVNPPAATGLASLSVNPVSVIGGVVSVGTVTLGAPAPAGGAVVTLSSDNAAATVPASIKVAAGATALSFKVTSHAVAVVRTVTISASYGGTTRTAVVTVTPAALSAVTVAPAALGGGAAATGTVTLTGIAPAAGIVVALSSNNAAAVVPASVTIAAGAKTANFALTTKLVAVATPVTISATFGGVTKSKAISVVPVTLSSATVSPVSVTGGTAATGTVKINGAAPSAGVTVTLASANPAVASVPASVVVPAGATTATFTVTTHTVIASTPVTLAATYKAVTKSPVLTVTP
jgi:hypothetical protein